MLRFEQEKDALFVYSADDLYIGYCDKRQDGETVFWSNRCFLNAAELREIADFCDKQGASDAHAARGMEKR